MLLCTPLTTPSTEPLLSTKRSTAASTESLLRVDLQQRCRALSASVSNRVYCGHISVTCTKSYPHARHTIRHQTQESSTCPAFVIPLVSASVLAFLECLHFIALFHNKRGHVTARWAATHILTLSISMVDASNVFRLALTCTTKTPLKN